MTDEVEYRRGLADAAVRIGSAHFRRVPVEEIAKAAGVSLDDVRAEAPDYRRGLADAVLRIARARFRPFVSVDLLAAAAAVTVGEVREANGRTPAQVPVPDQPAPRQATPRVSTRPEAPEGMKWCSKGKHFVSIVNPGTGARNFGRNRAREDGLSDYCMDHMREYWDPARRNK